MGEDPSRFSDNIGYLKTRGSSTSPGCLARLYTTTSINIDESINSKKISEKVSQCRKLSHIAENTIFHILIHCPNSTLSY